MRLNQVVCDRQVFGNGNDGLLFMGDSAGLNESFITEHEDKVKLVYVDPPFFTGQDFYYKPRHDLDVTFDTYKDKWISVEGYISMLERVFNSAKRIMSEEGAIYVHVDYRVSAEVRLLLNRVFGRSNFVNEIIWHYKSGGTSRKHFARKHDTIFIYAKSSKYMLDLEAVGTKRGNEKRNNLKKNIDADGKIYYSIKSMGKTYIYHEDDLIFPSDVWDDIPNLNQKDPERLGYDTQKPEALLERIILSSSNEGDIVADLFAGSGTTAAMAAKHNRKFIGVDMNRYSIQLMKSRVLKYCGDFTVKLGNIGTESELELYLDKTNSGYKLNIMGYNAGSTVVANPAGFKQLGINDIPSGSHFSTQEGCEENTETVMFLSAGYEQEGVYYPLDWSIRDRKGIDSSLRIPDRPYNIVVEVCDIYSNCNLFVLTV